MDQILNMAFVQQHVSRYAQHLTALHLKGQAELAAMAQQRQQQEQQLAAAAGQMKGSKGDGGDADAGKVMVRVLAVGQGFSQDSCESAGAEEAPAAAGAARAGSASERSSDTGGGSGHVSNTSSFAQHEADEAGSEDEYDDEADAFEDSDEDEADAQQEEQEQEQEGTGDVAEQQEGAASDRPRQRMIGSTWFANQEAALLHMQQAWNNMGSPRTQQHQQHQQPAHEPLQQEAPPQLLAAPQPQAARAPGALQPRVRSSGTPARPPAGKAVGSSSAGAKVQVTTFAAQCHSFAVCWCCAVQCWCLSAASLQGRRAYASVAWVRHTASSAWSLPIDSVSVVVRQHCQHAV